MNDGSLDMEDDDMERDLVAAGAEEGATAPALVLVVGCNGDTGDDAVVVSVVLNKLVLSCSVLVLLVDCNGDKGDDVDAVAVLFLLLLFCSGSSSCWKKLYGSTSI